MIKSSIFIILIYLFIKSLEFVKKMAKFCRFENILQTHIWILFYFPAVFK